MAQSDSAADLQSERMGFTQQRYQNKWQNVGQPQVTQSEPTLDFANGDVSH